MICEYNELIEVIGENIHSYKTWFIGSHSSDETAIFWKLSDLHTARSATVSRSTENISQVRAIPAKLVAYDTICSK
jgi:hypothetical protein